MSHDTDHPFGLRMHVCNTSEMSHVQGCRRLNAHYQGQMAAYAMVAPSLNTVLAM